jgi:hypothetical protein
LLSTLVSNAPHYDSFLVTMPDPPRSLSDAQNPDTVVTNLVPVMQNTGLATNDNDSVDEISATSPQDVVDDGHPLLPQEDIDRFLPGAPAKAEPELNPTVMNNLFWKYMVRHVHSNAWHASKWLGIQDFVKFPEYRPLWCFDRFGMSVTELPDGRVILIAGEHEDFYDPDFFIYNDVVVMHRQWETEEARIAELTELQNNSDIGYYVRPTIEERIATMLESSRDDEITIYGYPDQVFPPTDFHTATYCKDDTGKEVIYIIGGLGYRESIHKTELVVSLLDLHDYSITRLTTTGEVPPLILKEISGGERLAKEDPDFYKLLEVKDYYRKDPLEITKRRGKYHSSEGRSAELSTDGSCIIYTLKDGHQYKLSMALLEWSKVPDAETHEEREKLWNEGVRALRAAFDESEKWADLESGKSETE